MEDTNKRKVSLFGAVSMIVGTVVGAGMFVMIPSVVGMTGTGAVLAYCIAGVPVALGYFSAIQIAGTFPVSGGGYMMSSLFVSPLVAFALSATQVGAVGASICFQAFAAASFLHLFLPGMSIMTISLIIIAFFGVLNLIGVRVVSWAENILFAILVIATIFFIGGGIHLSDPVNYTSLMPRGAGTFAMTIGIGVFSWIGITTICSYAGDVKKPAKNIPRALIIAMIILALAYGLMALVFSGCFSMQEVNTIGDTIAATLATSIGGEIFKNILIFAIICAVLTSVNGFYLIASREMVAWAHQMTGPASFGKLHPKTNTPTVNVAIIFVYSFIFAFFAMSLEEYALVIIFPMMLAQIVMAIACFRMPKKDPERYNNSGIKLKRGTLMFSMISNLIACLFVIVFTYMASPRSGFVALGLLACTVIWYYARRAFLKRRGINLDEVSRQVDEHIATQIEDTYGIKNSIEK